MTLQELIANKTAANTVTAATISPKFEQLQAWEESKAKALSCAQVIDQCGEIESFELSIESAYDSEGDLLCVMHDGTGEQ